MTYKVVKSTPGKFAINPVNQKSFGISGYGLNNFSVVQASPPPPVPPSLGNRFITQTGDYFITQTGDHFIQQ